MFRPLSYILPIAILFLQVNCKGHHRHDGHGAHDGQWASWTSWRRERECLEGVCVGNNTEITTNPCSGTDCKTLAVVPICISIQNNN